LTWTYQRILKADFAFTPDQNRWMSGKAPVS
jgi:hypothetical protein